MISSINGLRWALYHSLWMIFLWVGRRFKQHLPWKWQNYLTEREIPHLVWRPHHAPEGLRPRLIWFHASSGEIEYIKPLLRLWKSQHPEDLLFLTYFSTSARKMIPLIAEIDGWAALPPDLPSPCKKFLQKLQPDILILSRTDLWPTLLQSLDVKPLGPKPKILVASTWAQGNQKTKGLGKWMSQWCLKYLQKVCVVSSADQEWLTAFAPHTPIALTGDPRFDQVQFRLQNPSRPLPEKLKTWAHSAAYLLIAGSTWSEDEQVLIQAWKNLREKNQSPQKYHWILVPHETTTEHLSSLKQKLQSENLPFTLWSEVQNTMQPLDTTLLIFDEKGWLANLYALAGLAFVGGSFKKQVHSVMEPLGCGIPVIVGPAYKNNREALEFSSLAWSGFSMVTEVRNSASLAAVWESYATQENAMKEQMRAKIKAAFHEREGGTFKTYQEIKNCLENQTFTSA